MSARVQSTLRLNPEVPPARLALVYARPGERPLWRGYFALEARLAETELRVSQPIMAQLRLAWWRDRLATPAREWPAGEPLLASLAPWDAERSALVALVDGWEALLVEADDGRQLAEARVAVMLALGRLLEAGAATAIERVARAWVGLGEGEGRLPTAMRPLAVLRAASAGGRAGKAARLLRLALTGR